jgi:hypothetical protein
MSNERCVSAWAIAHESNNLLDGHRQWLEGTPYHASHTLLFGTRAEARTHLEQAHGYLRNRADLRKEPFGWRVPKVVKVAVSVKEVI